MPEALFAPADELGSLVSHLKARLEGQERNQSEIGDMAMKLLGLSQPLRNKWLVADVAEKCVILEIVHSDFSFKNASLTITRRKPFDTLVEGLQMENGTGKYTQFELFWQGISEYPRELLPLLAQCRKL